MCDTKDKLIEQAGGVLEKTYDDVVHPSAKSIGNTLSLVPRTVGVWLGRWEKWVVNGEESIKLTAAAVQEKASKIPEDKLTEPESYVAIPAIQQLSYCYDSEELREMYANLLVSSMNIDTKYHVHPAFVDIIKQLTPDEAKLLKKLSLSSGKFFPVINVNLTKANGSYEEKIRNFTNIAEGTCDCPSNIYSYLDNFARLKLIEFPDGIAIDNNERYFPLEQHSDIKNIIEQQTFDGQKFKIERRLFQLTEFGLKFIEICIDNI